MIWGAYAAWTFGPVHIWFDGKKTHEDVENMLCIYLHDVPHTANKCQRCGPVCNQLHLNILVVHPGPTPVESPTEEPTHGKQAQVVKSDYLIHKILAPTYQSLYAKLDFKQPYL